MLKMKFFWLQSLLEWLSWIRGVYNITVVGSETVRRYIDHFQACGYPVPVPIELPPVELRFQWSLLQQHLVYVGL